MRFPLTATIVLAALVCGVVIVRGRSTDLVPVEQDPPVRLSMHAAPPEDVALHNAVGLRRVPAKFTDDVFPDKRPAVVLFLKAGCGCSENFARMFSIIEPHLRPIASCLAVIEGDETEGNIFLKSTGLSTPHLIQTDGSLATAWGITKAGCMALVRNDGDVEAVWPGVSRQGFRDIASRLNATDILPEESLNSLPGAATAGCPLKSVSLTSTPGVSK